MKWRDFDQKLWEEVKKEAMAERKSFLYNIYASDIDFKASRIAQINADAAGVGGYIQFQKKAFKKLQNHSDSGIMVMNPPYDERLKIKDINAFYNAIGDKMKQDFPDFTAWILSSNKEAMKCIGLKPTVKHQLWNGALECKYHGFELFEGSRR